MNISPFEQGNIFNRDPLRERKLLLHKKEILKLTGQLNQDGYALIPLSVYLKGSQVLKRTLRGECPFFDSGSQVCCLTSIILSDILVIRGLVGEKKGLMYYEKTVGGNYYTMRCRSKRKRGRY